MKPLPDIMVAPNGARRKKADHPALPVTISETVETAKACFEAGATGLHAHVRDENQQHVLDAGLYRELIAEMSLQLTDMQVQITTEAVGIYTPEQQRELVRNLKPDAVSIAMKEMLSDGDKSAAKDVYNFAVENGIAVQHILYSPDELSEFITLVSDGIIPAEPPKLIFVLGRYTKDQQSDPETLKPFLYLLEKNELEADWAICAFGSNETACLQAAIQAGGKVRVGFENSLWNADGSLAADNAERVREISAIFSAR